MAKLNNLLPILAIEGKESIPSEGKESVGFWTVPVSLSAKAFCFRPSSACCLQGQPAFETYEEGTGSFLTPPGSRRMPEEGCFSFPRVAVGGYPCAGGSIFR